MVVEVSHRWRLAAPWHTFPDGGHALWWWKHPTQGILQSDTMGIEAAFKLVHSNIVRRFVAHPSYQSTDKMGDAYFRDHAVAVDHVMSEMWVEDIMDELKASIAACYAAAE